jgi:hypothetical protein
MPKERFPGYKKCMEMMRKHNPHIQEEGFHALLPRVNEFVHELMHEFQVESDHGLRCWILELIGEARSPDAFQLFETQLHSDDESFRTWAIYGLKNLDTKEARKILWEARNMTFVPKEETRLFRKDLEQIAGYKPDRTDY